VEQLDLFKCKEPEREAQPQEWKIVAVRECPTPEEMQCCDTPQKAADYWRLHIEGAQSFDPERESFVVIVLNAKLKIRCHHVVSVGTLNECLVHPREVFRLPIMCAAFAIVLMHNHPSGESAPSDADRKMTRRLREVAEIHGISLMDHVIVGRERHFSFKECGLL